MIGPKTWDRIVGIFLGFWVSRDCPENQWAVWVFLFYQNCFKSCICMGNAGNGLWIGPKTWDRNCRNFWRLYGLSVTVQNFSGCGFVLTYALNGCLVCIGPRMAVDCGFTK